MKTREDRPRVIRPRLRVAFVALAVTAAFVVAPAVPAAAAGSDWVELGPDGGSIQALALAPSDPLTLYAGTFGNGVFRSRDGGTSWVVAHRGMGRAIVSALAADPRDAAHVFAGTSDGRLFASDDNGASWRVPSGSEPEFPPGKSINALVLDDSRPPVLWAAAGPRVHRSSDFGQTWSASTPGTPTSEGDAVLALAVNPGRPGEIWAGTSWGVFSSRDWGSTWAEHTLDGHAFTPATAVAIDPGNPETVYAASYDHWTGGPTGFPVYAVMRSTDGGVSWTHFFFPSAANGPPVTLAIDPADSQHLVAAAASGVAASRDGGATWPSWSSLEAYVYAALIDPTDGERILAATGAGVLVSTNGGAQWAPSNAGLRAASLGTIAVAGGPHPRVLAATGTSGIMALDPVSGTWAVSGEGLLAAPYSCCPGITSIAVDPSSPSTVYAGANVVGMFKSRDAGRHWTPARDGLERGLEDPGEFYGPAALAMDPRYPSILYAASDNGVFKTSDGAASWSESNDALLAGHFLLAIAVDPMNTDVVICGAYDAFRSSDGGRHWERTASPSPTRPMRQLVADPHRGGRFYALVYSANGLFRSDDRGLTWTKLAGPAEGGCFTQVGDWTPLCPYVSTVAVDPFTPGSVYVGTANGVWRSSDDGQTWSAVGSASAGLLISSIAFDPSTHAVYAGSVGAGLLGLRQSDRVRLHLRRVSPPLAARGLLVTP